MTADELAVAKEQALSGSAEAARKLADYYELRQLEYEEAFKWLRVCAENGDVVCEYNFGFVLVRKGTEEDELRGRFWLKRAAMHGSTRAVELLDELEEKRKKRGGDA